MAYLEESNFHQLAPDQITTKNVFDYLNYLILDKKLAITTRNNYMTDLKTCYSKMNQIGIVENKYNPCAEIKK